MSNILYHHCPPFCPHHYPPFCSHHCPPFCSHHCLPFLRTANRTQIVRTALVVPMWDTIPKVEQGPFPCFSGGTETHSKKWAAMQNVAPQCEPGHKGDLSFLFLNTLRNADPPPPLYSSVLVLLWPADKIVACWEWKGLYWAGLMALSCCCPIYWRQQLNLIHLNTLPMSHRGKENGFMVDQKSFFFFWILYFPYLNNCPAFNIGNPVVKVYSQADRGRKWAVWWSLNF